MEENIKVPSFRPKLVADLTLNGRGRGRGRGKMVWGGGTGIEALDPVRRSTQCIQTLRMEITGNSSKSSGEISSLVDLELKAQVSIYRKVNMPLSLLF